ncbi:MAG TPA: hypothetical protein VGU23_03785, partial [Acidobacteriaceae bacterium]|nr:hypothetical protein [Acidobacteriaceae bacterium]
PAILGYVRRVDSVNPQINGVAPWTFRMVSVDDVKFAVVRVVDVKAPLVLAKIGCPYNAMKSVKRRGDRTPVDEIGRAPDEQPRRVIEA